MRSYLTHEKARNADNKQRVPDQAPIPEVLQTYKNGILNSLPFGNQQAVQLLLGELDPSGAGINVEDETAKVLKEIGRQREILKSMKKSEAINGKIYSLNEHEKILTKKQTDVFLAIERLNRAISFLNKNIQDSIVPDEVETKKTDTVNPETKLTLQEAYLQPEYIIAKNMGLLDNEELSYWLDPEYLDSHDSIPDKFCGTIMELIAKDKIEQMNEPDYIEDKVDVLRGIRIGKFTGSKFTPKSEIDLLLVEYMDEMAEEVVVEGEEEEEEIEGEEDMDRRKMIVKGLYEVKSDKSGIPKSLQQDISKKIKALTEAKANGDRIMYGKTDITDRLVIGEGIEAESVGPELPAEVKRRYDIEVKMPAEIGDLYRYINKYRFALSKIWY